MKFNLKLIALLVMPLALGCSKKEGDAEAAKKDPAADFKLESVQADIKKIEAALAAGEDAQFKCAAGLSYAKDFATSSDETTQKAGEEITKLCTYDVPMLAATQAVSTAEAARAATPEKSPLSECFNANWEMAVEELEKNYSDDATFVALKERWTVACPPKSS